MKRDMDLVRKILIAIEQDEGDPLGWINLDVPNHSGLEVSYHVQIMEEAGLVEAQDLSTNDGYEYKPKRLTWRGHEFLDAARSDTLWERAKALTIQETGGLSLEIIRHVLIDLGKKALGL